MRLVQFTTKQGDRRVGAVSDLQRGALNVLADTASVYELARSSIEGGIALAELVQQRQSGQMVDYDTIISVGRLLPPLDHPYDAAHCLVSGSGMTHIASGEARDQLRLNQDGAEQNSDTMRLFRLGLDQGKPNSGTIGAQPGWFYKGDGSCVMAPGNPFEIENLSLTGSEEPELTGLYIIGHDGLPYRVGFAVGNDFSDHIMESQNALYLAHSKLRQCAFGPELLLGPLPREINGTSRVLRDGKVLWEKPFYSGETHMIHSVANIEYHHFKYRRFRRPGDIHVHFLGTAVMSSAEGIETRSGDVFEISAEGFGRPLRNTLKRLETDTTIEVRTL